MKNFMQVNGKKIEISQETADNLEREFSPKSKGQLLVEKYDGKAVKHAGLTRVKVELRNENAFFIIGLPHSNTAWTYAAWDLAKEIVCEGKAAGYNTFPSHDNTDGCAVKVCMQNYKEHK